MASPFDINPLSGTVPLDDRGAGETTFTVKNVTPQDVWARAAIVPDRADRADWFTVDRPERVFQPGEVEQIAVRLLVPPGKPTGASSFRLRVASVKRSDEDFTIGPPVGFEIRPVEPAPSRKPFPWWIPLVAGGVLLLVGLAIVLWPGGIAVPRVVGLSVEQARESLDESGLRLGATTEENSSEPAGRILRQKPEEGEEAEEGAAVDVVIARSSVKVPDVMGRTVPAATAALQSAGLKVGGTAPTGEGTLGLVVGQDPPAGQDVAPGHAVNLTVPRPVTMPMVTKVSEIHARNLLVAAGLKVRVRRIGGFGGRTHVVRQHPAPGTRLGAGTEVSLDVVASAIF